MTETMTMNQGVCSNDLNHNLYVFGDSIAKGIVQEEGNSKYEVLKDNALALVANATQWTVKNFASFGANILRGWKIFTRQRAGLAKGATVILEFGNNDCDMPWAEIAANPSMDWSPQVPLENFKERYRALIEEVRKEGGRPVLLTLTPLHAERFFQTISKGLDQSKILEFLNGDVQMIYRWQESYNMAVWQLAFEEKVPVIDIRSAFLQEHAYERFICQDGMHPNEKGHALIEKTLVAGLSKLAS